MKSTVGTVNLYFRVKISVKSYKGCKPNFRPIRQHQSSLMHFMESFQSGYLKIDILEVN